MSIYETKFYSGILTKKNLFFFIISGLQYAYLNGDSPPKSKDQNGANIQNQNDPTPNKEQQHPKGARSEITLDELDDL